MARGGGAHGGNLVYANGLAPRTGMQDAGWSVRSRRPNTQCNPGTDPTKDRSLNEKAAT
ncbi:hypothetical protein GCM10007386_14010 [Pseudoduganella dura]|nr:hypothetical protein GCM10007386_14010 [Pseudoduganella dura]